jgi:hypothetical protein
MANKETAEGENSWSGAGTAILQFAPDAPEDTIFAKNGLNSFEDGRILKEQASLFLRFIPSFCKQP